MPDVISATSPRPVDAPLQECVVQARAEIVSLGGGVLLAICIVLTGFCVMALLIPGVTAVQQAIAALLVLFSWAYLYNSTTERLSLVDDSVVFEASLSRTRRVPLAELESLTLIHEGLNLERGIETLEFQRAGKRMDRVSLGPCWQRNKLEAFIMSVQSALESPPEVLIEP